uniref:Ovule protein n=1 Tax=Haemonchus placei TaxID=6290 RepID=A0A0N4W1W5_HAEPC
LTRRTWDCFISKRQSFLLCCLLGAQVVNLSLSFLELATLAQGPHRPTQCTSAPPRAHSLSLRALSPLAPSPHVIRSPRKS